MAAKQYKWNSPAEWLSDVNNTMSGEDLLNFILEKCSSDDIQDYFQDDMEKDGYFEEISPAQ